MTGVQTCALPICREGVTALAEALKTNHSITKINLAANDIGGEAAAVIDKLLGRNKKIFSDTSDMLKALVVIKTQEERLVELEKYTLNGNPDLLREFFNRPDAFKALLEGDKGNEASQDIKNFVLDNFFEIHDVAKDMAQDSSAFK